MEATREDIQEFQSYFCSWGDLDVQGAVEIIKEHNLNMEEIQEQIESFCEDCDVKLNDIDVVYQVYEHILQMARNEISSILNYDFINDYQKEGGIYTYDNYVCSSYDYDEEAIEELTDKLSKTTQEEKDQLLSNRYYVAFLKLLGIFDKIHPKED